MTAVSQTPTMAPTAPEGDRSVLTRFVGNTAWSVFGAVVSRGLTLVGFVVAARLLGAAGFGAVGMVQSTQGLFGVLAGGGLGLAATKYVAEYRAVDRARASRCYALTLLIAVVTGGIGALVLCVFAGSIAENVLHTPQLVTELQAATGLLLFAAISGVQTGAARWTREFSCNLPLPAILRGVCLVFAMSLGICLAGILGAVLGLVLTEAVAVLANQIVLRRLMQWPWSALAAAESSWRELRELCRFGGLAVLGSIATTLALWAGNVLLVSQTDGYASLGVFNAAERWRQLLLFLPATVSPIFLSMLSHLHGRADRAGYRRVFDVSLWVGAATVLPVVGIVALASMAMGVFGVEYREGAMTLAILATSAVAVVFNNLLGQILVSKGAIWWRAALDVLLAGVVVLVAWPMVPLWRDQGLALAHLVAYAATAVALIVPVACYLRQPTGEPASE